jgi:hypothetical protein
VKLRVALGVVSVAVMISACGGPSVPQGAASGGGGSASAASSPASGASGSAAGDAAPAGASGGDFCARLQAAEDKLDDFNDSVGNGDLAGASKVIAADITVFQQLAQGAPAQVQPALSDIVEVLKGAQGTLSNPTDPNAAMAMQNLATKLPGDLNAMGNYMSDNCQG